MPVEKRAAFSAVPDLDDFSDSEPTPITDLNQAFSKISRVSKLTEQLVHVVGRQEATLSMIPEIKLNLDAASKSADRARVAANEARDEVLIVRTRQEEMGNRLTRIEKVGHPCIHEAEIDQLKKEAVEQRRDQAEGIKTRQIVIGVQEKVASLQGAIETVGDDVDGLHKSRFSMLLSVVAAAVGIVITIIGASWALGSRLEGLSHDISAEREMRLEQHTTLKGRLDKLPTKAQFTEFEHTVKEGQTVVQAPGGDHCSMLSNSQKQRLAREVKNGFLPESFLCP